MKWLRLVYLVVFLAVMGFVYYAYLGGLAKIEYTPSHQTFSVLVIECNDGNYYASSCFNNLKFFLEDREVDSHKTITIYKEKDGFFDMGFFDEGVVLDYVEMSRLGEHNYEILNFDKKYLTFEFPQKNWLSFIVYDRKMKNFLREEFTEKGKEIKNFLRVYDSVNSKLIYLIEVGE